MILDENRIKKIVEQVMKEIEINQKEDEKNEQTQKQECCEPERKRERKREEKEIRSEEVLISEQKTNVDFVMSYDIIDFVTEELGLDLPEDIKKSDLFELVMELQDSMGVQFGDVVEQIEQLREELEQLYPDSVDLIPYVDMEKLLYDERRGYVNPNIDSVKEDLKQQLEEELGLPSEE